jgi:hypothetical protein
MPIALRTRRRALLFLNQGVVGSNPAGRQHIKGWERSKPCPFPPLLSDATDVAILEVVGANVMSVRMTWTLSIGAVPVSR